MPCLLLKRIVSVSVDSKKIDVSVSAENGILGLTLSFKYNALIGKQYTLLQ